MHEKRDLQITLIKDFLSASNEKVIDMVFDFVVALQNDKIVKSQTDDGWLTYVFIENRND